MGPHREEGDTSSGQTVQSLQTHCHHQQQEGDPPAVGASITGCVWQLIGSPSSGLQVVETSGLL